MDDIKPPAKPTRDQVPADNEPQTGAQPVNQPPVKPVQDIKPPTLPSDALPTEPKDPPAYAAGGDDDKSDDKPEGKEAADKQKETKVEQSDAPVVPKPRTAKLPIFLAFVVAIALAGLTVWAYMNSTSNDSGREQTESAVQEEKTPATESDVQEATEAADEAAESAGEATDFSEEGLSDQSLGL